MCVIDPPFHNAGRAPIVSLLFPASETGLLQPGDHTIAMKDLDGTLTGTRGATVVHQDLHVVNRGDTRGLCTVRKGWGLAVCKKTFARVSEWRNGYWLGE